MKLLSQAQTMLHHATLAECATTSINKMHHCFLAYLCSRGMWKDYFEYAHEKNITPPDSAHVNGMILTFK